jgi:hypothetical protein
MSNSKQRQQQQAVKRGGTTPGGDGGAGTLTRARRGVRHLGLAGQAAIEGALAASQGDQGARMLFGRRAEDFNRLLADLAAGAISEDEAFDLVSEALDKAGPVYPERAIQ